MKLIGWAIIVASVPMLAGPLPAAPQSPVAIVEEVSGNSADVGFMDYVEAGRVIRLAPKDSIVLSYMKSCVRESMTGGTMTVGTDHSEVAEPAVFERSTVACDAGKLMPSSDQGFQTAGLIFRAPAPSVPEPQFTLYGLSPMLRLGTAQPVKVERLDKKGERYAVSVAKKDLIRGAFYDFAKSKRSFAPGGTYRLVQGSQQLIFRIDPNARPGMTPIIGRLVQFKAPG
jgi:hypothetical protein